MAKGLSFDETCSQSSHSLLRSICTSKSFPLLLIALIALSELDLATLVAEKAAEYDKLLRSFHDNPSLAEDDSKACRNLSVEYLSFRTALVCILASTLSYERDLANILLGLEEEQIRRRRTHIQGRRAILSTS